MTSMDQIHRIRDLYYVQDKSLAEIASIENLDWRTGRKYVDKEDFNEAPPSPKEFTDVLRTRQKDMTAHTALLPPMLPKRRGNYALSRKKLIPEP